MSVFGNGVMVLTSDLGLIIRKVVGCRIGFDAISLVSLRATIKTKKGGKVCLGRKTAISPNTEISATEGVVSLGNNCFVNRNCMIVAHEKIIIGDGTTIGPGVYIYDHDHDGKGGFISLPITIEKNVWIGAGTIILKGTHIEEGAVIAAGSIVSGHVCKDTLLIQKRVSAMLDKHK